MAQATGGLYAEIVAALGDYFDGIYEGDVAKLRTVFHPAAHLYSATEGEVVDLPLDGYMELVGGREAPAASKAPRYDRVISIDLSGPKSALAKVELAIPPKYFTDYLTLLKANGRWQIISKTYHFIVHS